MTAGELVLPRFGTPRCPDRRTLGPQVGEAARRLRMPLMPWQQHVLDVGLELDDDGGLYYSEIDLTTARQNGKTSIVLSKLVHRAKALRAFGGAQNVLYTAQDRNSARKKWLEDHVAKLERARAFDGQYDIRKANGSEQITWRNGSRHGICAPTDTAAHGETLDEGVIDEAFAFQDDVVEQGMSPAMITRRNAQFFVLSTAGDEESFYLWRKVLAGRKLDGSSRVAFFEWSSPEDLSRDDRRGWLMANPAMGLTITEAKLARELERLKRVEGGLDLFDRAHRNLWPKVPVLPEAVDQRKLTEELWRQLHDPRSMPLDPVVLAVDASPDVASVSVAVAAYRSDGRRHVEVMEHRAGSRRWLVPYVASVWVTEHPACVAVAAGSPAMAFVADLEAAGVEVEVVPVGSYAAACGALVSAAKDGAVKHRSGEFDQVLLDAVKGALPKQAGDQFTWSRATGVDISPLVAVTLAHHLVAQSAEGGEEEANLW